MGIFVVAGSLIGVIVPGKKTKPEMEAAFARNIGAQFYFHQGEMEMIVWQRPSLEAMCHLTGRSKYRLAQEILNGKFDALMHSD